MKQQMNSMKKKFMNNLGCHGGILYKSQGMLKPMTPSMLSHVASLIPPHMTPNIMEPIGPTSPPVYQPRPQPSYLGPSYVHPRYPSSLQAP